MINGKYRYEIHCHTKEVSLCGKIPAKEIAEKYKNAGFDGIVITDHYSPMTFSLKEKLFHQKAVDKYLKGYNEAKKCEDENFTVMLGMEIRYHLTVNDYLVYGMTEEFLRENSHLMMKYPKKFYEIAHKNGLVVIQAHPFRKFISRINPKYLDGVEIYNGKENSPSEGENAVKWADKSGLKIRTSGSDFHKGNNFAKGGIITDEKIKNNNDLLRILKKGEFGILKYGKEI